MASSERPTELRRQVLDAMQLRDVLDAWDEGMQIISSSWQYLYVNAAAARHGRRAREELYGRTLLECYPGVEATPLFAVLQSCMTDRLSAQLLNEFEFPDGSKAWFELRVKPCVEGIIVLSIARPSGDIPRASLKI